jgi:hypothetical protein
MPNIRTAEALDLDMFQCLPRLSHLRKIMREPHEKSRRPRVYQAK